MTEETQVENPVNGGEKKTENSEAPEGVRVYEVGYHVVATKKEDEVEQVVSEVRAAIEKIGGSFITEGAPQMMTLAYPFVENEGGKNTKHERAYFGWIKFEADAVAPLTLRDALSENKDILRFIIFKTVREETRASLRPTPVLREVKRTDTITSTPQRGREAEKEAGDVSEKDLDKALEDLTG